MKILIVDDSPVNQLVAGSFVESFDLSYLVADNGLIALDKLKNDLDNEIVFVLMDCQMPELDGFRATKFIRRGYCGEAKKHIPIIALTGSANDSDIKACYEAGMDSFLSKPINKERLAELLEKFQALPKPPSL